MGGTFISLSAKHMARQGEMSFEPQRANNGFLVVNWQPGWNWPTAVSAPAAITLSLDSFPIPEDENAVMELHYMNEVHKAASKARTTEMEIVIKDFVDVPVAQMLQEWRRRVYNPTRRPVPILIEGQTQTRFPPFGGLGLVKDYKTNGSVVLFAPNGGYQRSYELEGIWPSRLSPGNIDMTSEEQVKISMVLQVDRISDFRLAHGEPYMNSTPDGQEPASPAGLQ